ncbi:MAG: hypothetical protein R3F13_06405 [Prosthecobacter sp.]
MRALLLWFCPLVLSGLAGSGFADLPVSPQVLDPQTPAEAWNVIRLATANVSRLLKEERVTEVPQQISLCSPALRLLARTGSNDKERRIIAEHSVSAFRLINDIARDGLTGLQPGVEVAFTRFQAELKALRGAFVPGDTAAEIYVCPVHAEMLSAHADTPCRFCSGRLRIRRIPYTDLQAVPEEPQVVAGLSGDPMVSAGKNCTLNVQFSLPNGSPRPVGSFVRLHGEPVRLLIVDQALGEFHVTTPVPAGADAPGRWVSSFIPRGTGPYRIWAEVAPEETAIPEYPFVDLGGEFKEVDRSRRDFIETLDATVSGLRFQLSFGSGNGGAPVSRQVGMMRLHVSDALNQPVKRLEPFMRAFAHLTGIYDDGKTVIRLHPSGGDILRDDLRGGPWLAFKIYPPRAGFIRFFCQVKVDGRIVTAPLGFQVPR